MNKTIRRLVSLALALTMALSLAVSASAAELTLDHLVSYGISPVTVSASSINLSAETTNVMNYGDTKTYICTAPVTVSNNGNPYCGIAKLIENNDPRIPQLWEEGQGLSGDGTPVTLTKPGKYILTAESVDYPAKLYVVIQVVEGTAAPEEPAEPVTPGLHNFKKVNTYKVGQYSDVPANHTFAENAKAGYEYNIMQGYGSSFGVSSNITRLASIIIACRLNCIYYDGSNHIDTTYSGTTSERYLAYAKDHGILCDFADTSKSATRAEFAAILSSALPDEALPPINTVVDNAIPDVTMDMDYADDIYRLYRAGILNGSDAKGTFYPSSNITRGAACAIATRMCDAALRKSVNMATDLLSEALLSVDAEYVYALEKMLESVTIVGYVAEYGGTLDDLNDAFAAYVDFVDALKSAKAYCGNYAALSEIKDLLSEAITILENSLPSHIDVNSTAFWEEIVLGIDEALFPLEETAYLIEDLTTNGVI